MINCTTIELLEPQPQPIYSIDPLNATLPVEEGGILSLSIGIAVYNIVFTIPKISANYDFLESDVSSTDAVPLAILPSMTLKTVNGFRATMDAFPDTINYILRWRVRVVSL